MLPCINKHFYLSHRPSTAATRLRSHDKPHLQNQELTDRVEELLSRANDSDPQYEIKNTEDKGRGIFATMPIKKGMPVLEYCGELISADEGKNRDKEYEKDPSKGCYLLFFKAKDKNWCVDATQESERKGRLVNHSKKNPNLIARVHLHKGFPRVILTALCDIAVGQELLYDYGERRKDVLKDHSWLKH